MIVLVVAAFIAGLFSEKVTLLIGVIGSIYICGKERKKS